MANALAQEPKAYLEGVLLQVDSVPCASADSSIQSLANEPKKAGDCREYTLQTDRVLYRIRPKDTMHGALLPTGERVRFRLHQDEIILRALAVDAEERECAVLSIRPRSDSITDAHHIRPNHLQ